MRIIVAGLIVLMVTGSVLADSPATQPSGIIVQAKVVRGVSEKPASQPEAWVVEAVKALPGQAGLKPPLFVEATMDWLPLSLDKPTSFNVRGMGVTATVKRIGQSLDIRLGLAQGNAQAVTQLVVNAAPGSRKAMQVSSNLDGERGYVTVEVSAAGQPSGAADEAAARRIAKEFVKSKHPELGEITLVRDDGDTWWVQFPASTRREDIMRELAPPAVIVVKATGQAKLAIRE